MNTHIPRLPLRGGVVAVSTKQVLDLLTYTLTKADLA